MVLAAAVAVQAKAQTWEFDFNTKLEGDWAALGGNVKRFSADDQAKLKTLLGPVADQATKDAPAVRDMLQMVRAAAAKN
jgi:hypothetical protein